MDSVGNKHPQNHIQRVIGLIGLLLVLGSGTNTSPTGAASTGSIGVVPAFPDPAIQLSKSWFLYEVDPGATIEDTARITNRGESEMRINLEALDAFMTPDGSFALAGATNENQDIGTWVELETGEVTVPAGQAKLVKFKITVPQDAEVGDHIGGLAVQKMTDEPDITLKSGGTQLGIVTRAGARIYLTVKGDIQRSLRLTGRSLVSRNDKMVLRLRWDNRGNVRATPELVEGRIWGIFGLYDRVENTDLGEIFPHKSTIKETVWPGKNRPLFGPFLARLTIQDTFVGLNPASPLPATQPMTVWLFVFFVPYLQLLVILAVLFLLWCAWQFRRWQYLIQLAGCPVVAYRVKRSDHLVGVAERYGLNWKLLARLNNLKPPYSLHNVANLYLPDARGRRRPAEVPNFFRYLIGPLTNFINRGKSHYTIVIERGDTAKTVTKFTHMPWAEILAYNHLKISARPKVGMELKVPRRQRKRFR
ncbi:MAG: hypothetical protein VE98_C0001G0381 [candidate division Kazan bacterium GW2011_GWA1_50_15]|uniref:LysM domain-containing protein n=2 Tax=Bacteria division Kazan-3B-28 TaxID=1798534 RepID=A0A0G1X6G9_UNCK3|nr:MAG: hypothetical protein VE98_C0001G0381 [candidate division Kazan bacterium GW2011_GWA1_50_15]KKW25927.1 MAG: hypothetical protein VE99_C0001G0568 [candidate division Kazan bacterium GW2011_GWC1_52_13]KKW26581.1 MAG: hypothetical protein VF00_C0003G0011 [candidate division Kazan bacterium GW2011_GWB1_52_7]HAV65680.1 hypothetical protein [Patescibacteria group bacterium]HCR42628.1 hypothetical protein [Patescibacteria group bacterium]